MGINTSTAPFSLIDNSITEAKLYSTLKYDIGRAKLLSLLLQTQSTDASATITQSISDYESVTLNCPSGVGATQYAIIRSSYKLNPSQNIKISFTISALTQENATAFVYFGFGTSFTAGVPSGANSIRGGYKAGFVQIANTDNASGSTDTGYVADTWSVGDMISLEWTATDVILKRNGTQVTHLNTNLPANSPMYFFISTNDLNGGASSQCTLTFKDLHIEKVS